MSEENKAIARAVYEAWETGDLDRLDDLIAPDAVDHDPYNPHGSEGLEGFKKTITMYREAFPDTQFAIEDQIAEGDRVVTRWTATGTHEGELMGAAPTGKKASVTGIGIDRIEDGKIAEVWVSWDTLGMMRNLGLIPEAQPAQA
jgi:steroid delta-isomerase-like uncharacterized protein